MKPKDGAHVVFHKFLNTRGDAVQAVLLYKRTQDAPTDPGCWSLFGGVVEASESPIQAARREVKEELKAIDVDLGKVEMKELCDVPVKRNEGTCSISYFSASLDIGINKLRLRWNLKEKKVEGEGLGWFTEKEVKHLMMRPEDRTAVTKFFELTVTSI